MDFDEQFDAMVNDENFQAIMDLIRENLNELNNSKRTLMLDPQKAKTLRMIHENFKSILSDDPYSSIEYQILFDGTTVSIQVLFDRLSVAFENMDKYREIINNVVELNSNIFDDRVVISMYLPNLYIDITDE